MGEQRMATKLYRDRMLGDIAWKLTHCPHKELNWTLNKQIMFKKKSLIFDFANTYVHI